jgi:hypothetical protein
MLMPQYGYLRIEVRLRLVTISMRKVVFDLYRASECMALMSLNQSCLPVEPPSRQQLKRSDHAKRLASSPKRACSQNANYNVTERNIGLRHNMKHKLVAVLSR